MHNFYNIIPIILIDIFIILVFEGLLFFLYLVKEQQHIISKQLHIVFKNINKQKQKYNILDTNTDTNTDTNINTNINTNIFTYVKKYIEPYIKQSMIIEKLNISQEYINGLIYYFIILVSIIIFLLVYVYIVYRKLHKSINWYIVLITVVITIGLIIYLEYLYVTYILFNKQFNDTQIKLDFINAIATKL